MSNTKKIWEGIRDIVNISKKNKTIPKEIKYKGVTHTESLDMANSFNDFFVNIGNTVEEKIPHVNPHFSTFLKEPNIQCFFLVPQM